MRPEAEVAREHASDTPREDFVAPGEYDSFAFAIDPSGRLAWESNDIDGDHVVAILSERVSDAYLAFLRERGVSYLLAGAREVDLALALEKIGERFGVRTLMLEGGGRINGAMLRAGLIDEVSVLIAPVADGRVGTPALFDVDGDDVAPQRLALESAWTDVRATCSGSGTASRTTPGERCASPNHDQRHGSSGDGSKVWTRESPLPQPFLHFRR
jgi:2,5-diamino-6-(ribosylamino)-4(3H)-pyrimidinone 5'-phosphate reductase